MALAQGQIPSSLSELVALESQLASDLMDLLEDVEHTEFFDDEQRAELYTILKALQADSEMHRGTVLRVAQLAGEYVSDV